MKRNLFTLFTTMALVMSCASSSDDPFFPINNDPFVVTYSTVISPENVASIKTFGTMGAFYEINWIRPREGKNLIEMEVSFVGGCNRHAFVINSESTYDDRVDPLSPLDITLYLSHFNHSDYCLDEQNVELNGIDLSFLAPGKYNMSIFNVSTGVTDLVISDYEIL